MTELTRELTEKDPARPAIIDEFGKFDRSEVEERSNRLIHALRAEGLESGDVIAVLSNNRHEFFEIANAASAASWTFAPINWHFTPDEVEYVLKDSGAKALLADREVADLAAASVSEAEEVKIRVMFGGKPTEGFLDYEDMLSSASPQEPADQGSGAYLFYTSGTTGRPKGVSSTATEVGRPLAETLFQVQGFGALYQVPTDGIALVNSPLYHAGPFLYSALPAVLGNSLLIRRKFDPVDTLRLIDEYRITLGYFVPTHFVRMLRIDEEIRRAFDGSSLLAVYHTAAPCPPEVKRAMIEWWGPVINEVYGATEGGVLWTMINSEEWLKKPGSVGKTIPIVEILIIDENGERLGQNEVGQIYGRNTMGVDFEYKGDPEKTAKAHLEPGVMTFGDMGYLDDDGYLFLTDRKIDMIISGGVNIYPAEVEAVLITHPSVADVGVFGIPNDEFGEEVKAVVELTSGYEGSDELASELVGFAREKLAGYKVPRSIEFRTDLPRTPTGKLLKRQLREPYWEGRGRTI